ncbi:CBS domain-containing protein [Salipiger sp. 1_MG-2023]|uniref:CBS domain-containing protein n=1 Tax=Salipiger sp. 1_MG-2023 TaxID=3062665 RepID=UPI0026E2AFBC|nr:CBS domain-containing protein [Salipiger sp. 1_MG-2023]MDO6584122.1 CBS domain-containing protein [Salipiger sp. 1_MG-2023]
MPMSYQPHIKADDESDKTVSQSLSSNVKVAEATVHHVLEQKGAEVVSTGPDNTIGEVVKVLRDRKIGAILVLDDSGAIVGILSERDIVRRLADTPGQTLPQTVKELMTKAVETCTPAEPLVRVLRRMTDGRFRHMPVMDHGELVGMISVGDVVNYRVTALEYEALQLKQLIVG